MKRSGFTIIELTIILALIAIACAIMIPAIRAHWEDQHPGHAEAVAAPASPLKVQEGPGIGSGFGSCIVTDVATGQRFLVVHSYDAACSITPLAAAP